MLKPMDNYQNQIDKSKAQVIYIWLFQNKVNSKMYKIIKNVLSF